MRIPLAIALLFILSACSLAPSRVNAHTGPTPTDCECSAEGPHKALGTPVVGLAAGPALPAGAASTPRPLESYRESWEYYADAARGFSFEYPAAYTGERFGFCAVREAPVESGVVLRLDLGSRTALTAVETSSSLDDAVAAFRAGPALQDAQFDAPVQRVVGGQPAVSLGYRSGGTGSYAESTFFFKDGLLYRVDSGAPSACDIAELDLTELNAYAHLLESFAFE